MRWTLLALVLCACIRAQNGSDLNFTSKIGELRDLPDRLSRYLLEESDRHLSKRPRLTDEASVRSRGQQVRQQILKNLGPFPERTPLNPRVVGTIDRPAYRIEKIIFESQPGFYVTASLYLPKSGTAPYPAILFPLGHESGAKAHEAWQYALASFATKGFVALAWDPLGQGERSQFYDPDMRRSRLNASTREHSMLGVQTLVVGDSIARYTIWDGIRALDYLLSRKEVDPKRVGVTGNSGGGTHTAYLAALDDRLQVAAPSCYITSWSTLMKQLGPQDAEQNLPPWINLGYDFPDFLYAFAPKPYLVLSAIRDFFPIGGARASFAEVRRVYDSLGIADKLKMVEADDGHGYTLPRRLAAYAWFSKWLKGKEDDGVEPQITLSSESELQCTNTGQVSTSLGGESVFTLNQKRAKAVKANAPSGPDVLRAAREMSAFSKPSGPPQISSYGMLHGAGYTAEKIVYESEPGIAIPAVLFIPANKPSSPEAIIYADGRGKSAITDRIAGWMKSGNIVLAIDARGFGETEEKMDAGGRDNHSWLGDSSSITAALLLGKTMVGMRALDISRAVDVLESRAGVSLGKIRGVGMEHASVPMLFAAAHDDRIASVELDRMLVSWQSIVDSRLHRRAYEQVIPGAIQRFDLPDLVRAMAPKPVVVRSVVDAMGDVVPASQARALYGSALRSSAD